MIAWWLLLALIKARSRVNKFNRGWGKDMRLPSFTLEGKVAVVTGASGGLGRAIALGFAEAGDAVLPKARQLEEFARRKS